MSIIAIELMHPQSADLLPQSAFDVTDIKYIKIACGTSKISTADLSESNDFFPTYASYNSALFETSVILTVWEHYDELIGDNDITIMHSDITLHYDPHIIWSNIKLWLSTNRNRAIGITASTNFTTIWKDNLVPDTSHFIPKNDPMLLHDFDCGVSVWDYLKKCDYDIYEWAMDTQPRLIYSHQFCCSKDTYNKLGILLYKVVSKLRFGDVGLWTPHVFERLIALYLAKIGGDPILSTCFWHHSSSGAVGPGTLSLYGPRPRKYYKVKPKYLTMSK